MFIPYLGTRLATKSGNGIKFGNIIREKRHLIEKYNSDANRTYIDKSVERKDK